MRSSRRAPRRPVGPRVPAHAHDSLYPSTSSTPPASNLGRRRNPGSNPVQSRGSPKNLIAPVRAILEWILSLEVARSQRSRGHPATPCRADRRERPSRSHLHYLVRMTSASSYTATWMPVQHPDVLMPSRASHANPLALWRAARASHAKRPEPARSGSGRLNEMMFWGG